MERLPILYDVATAYHGCRDLEGLLHTCAARAAQHVQAGAALVWLPGDGGFTCRGRWFEPGTRFEAHSVGAQAGALAEASKAARGRALEAAQLKPALLPHIAEADRSRVQTAAYVPLQGPDGAGVLELLNKHAGGFTPEDVALLEEISRMTSKALETFAHLEREGQNQFAAIERLTSLYDISRIFNSTLELDSLLPIVAGKIRDILGAGACSVWLLDRESEEVYCAQIAGEDPTINVGQRYRLGEGVAGRIVRAGAADVIKDAAGSDLLAHRQEEAEGFTIRTLAVAPLKLEDKIIGAIEVINKAEGESYNDDDRFFLESLCEQAAIALNNANLLAAERKVRELDALLAISKEITGTLNLDRVLATVVNQAATVLPFDGCSIGIYDRGRFILAAVAGQAEVPKTPEMEELRRVLEWVSRQEGAVEADKIDGNWVTEPEEGAEELIAYLERVASEGFHAVILKDDQGVVGVLALESGVAEFLKENHLEVLAILAGQTTVAVRNAQLYQAVPLISFLQPILERKARLEAMPRSVLKQRLRLAGLTLAFLALCPWPMVISSNGQVLPSQKVVVSAQVEGLVKEVLLREGAEVQAGEVIARLDDRNARAKLERARAQLGIAQSELREAETRGDLGGGGRARLRVGMYQAETTLYETQLAATTIRAPAAGVILTPKIEEKVGQYLKTGDLFCEIADLDTLLIETNVPEGDIGDLTLGRPINLNLNALPTHRFRGTVELVSAQAVTLEGAQFFTVRGRFENRERAARPGMVGRAKIRAAGWVKGTRLEGTWADWSVHSFGWVLFRGFLRWLYRTAWVWWPF